MYRALQPMLGGPTRGVCGRAGRGLDKELACHKCAPKEGGGTGVLQLHLARAVVPPPRLRAKLVVFSAPLQQALYSPGRASPVR
jgi:hypothetical protein